MVFKLDTLSARGVCCASARAARPQTLHAAALMRHRLSGQRLLAIYSPACETVNEGTKWIVLFVSCSFVLSLRAAPTHPAALTDNN
jgi:hypothetical protein